MRNRSTQGSEQLWSDVTTLVWYDNSCHWVAHLKHWVTKDIQLYNINFLFPWIFHTCIQDRHLYGWLVVFQVPSTARSFRDGTPIYCPLRRTWSSNRNQTPGHHVAVHCTNVTTHQFHCNIFIVNKYTEILINCELIAIIDPTILNSV